MEVVPGGGFEPPTRGFSSPEQPQEKQTVGFKPGETGSKRNQTLSEGAANHPEAKPQSISIKIAIDIPVEVATETLAKIQPVLTQIASVASPAALPSQPVQPAPVITDQTEEEKAAARQFFEENKRAFRIKTIQLYRRFRRLEADYEKVGPLYTRLSKEFEWPSSVVASQLAQRKKEVRVYLKQRQLKTVLRLAYKGWSNKAIAKRIGFNDKKVARYLREARSLSKGSSK